MAQQGTRNTGTTSGQATGGRSYTMEDCIRNCQECHAICVETLQHCLKKGGKHADPEHIRLLEDCAQICQTSLDFMLRGSDMHSTICGACAEVCRACAESCEAMAEDEQMKKCAEACRRCADSCGQMAAGA